MSRMLIRVASQEDLPGIINCLNRSGTNHDVPMSLKFWQWKHTQNPFGSSPVLLAEVDDRIVGVRAFMQWSWRWHGKNYRALRAVDTSTDPEFQGQGVFTKLTTDLVNRCKEDGYHFIFNTPNDQSKQGYLKMGWHEVGKLPIRTKHMKSFLPLISKLKSSPIAEVDHALPMFNLVTALKNFDDSIARYPRPSGIYTIKTKKFLTWRYVDCPVEHYYGYLDGYDQEQLLLIYNIQKTSLGNGLIIYEIQSNSSTGLNKLDRALRIISRAFNPDYISIADLGDSILNESLKRAKFRKSRSSGPLITIRHLQKNLPIDWNDIGPWDATLGDLELF